MGYVVYEGEKKKDMGMGRVEGKDGIKEEGKIEISKKLRTRFKPTMSAACPWIALGGHVAGTVHGQ